LFNSFTEKLKQSYNLCIRSNAFSDPIENADHQYDRQLQGTSVKYAK